MAEFIIAATYGDIAQLGERLNGIQEVVGSIPIISTKFKTLKLKVSFKVFLYGKSTFLLGNLSLIHSFVA